jgi:hypothetical protein
LVFVRASLLHALLVSKTKRRKKKRLIIIIIIIIGFIQHLEYNAKLFERIVIGKRRSLCEQKHDDDDDKKCDVGTTKEYDNDTDVSPTNE